LIGGIGLVLAGYSGKPGGITGAAAELASPPAIGQGSADGGTVRQNIALGQRMARGYGWTGQQWGCLDSLWQGESGSGSGL